jgi:selenide,water dikinase
VVVGIDEADDVAAWRTSGSSEVVVSNVELLRAFASDPYLLGRVAAINALSDLDAKGVPPRAAQAIVALPLDLPEAEVVWILRQLLLGAGTVLEPRGVPLLGGHTARAADLLVGFSIEGLADQNSRLVRAEVEVGDVLLLTRALGSGVLLHADMAGRAKGRWVEALYRHLQVGNAPAAAVLRQADVRVCTDVTGFGLVGHLVTVLRGNRATTAQIELGSLPALAGALELLEGGERSSFHEQNRTLLEASVIAPPSEVNPRVALAADPQTAGGLLIVAPAASAPGLLAQLQQLPGGASQIGQIAAWSGAPVELLGSAG